MGPKVPRRKCAVTVAKYVQAISFAKRMSYFKSYAATQAV